MKKKEFTWHGENIRVTYKIQKKHFAYVTSLWLLFSVQYSLPPVQKVIIGFPWQLLMPPLAIVWPCYSSPWEHDRIFCGRIGVSPILDLGGRMDPVVGHGAHPFGRGRRHAFVIRGVGGCLATMRRTTLGERKFRSRFGKSDAGRSCIIISRWIWFDLRGRVERTE